MANYNITITVPYNDIIKPKYDIYRNVQIINNNITNLDDDEENEVLLPLYS